MSDGAAGGTSAAAGQSQGNTTTGQQSAQPGQSQGTQAQGGQPAAGDVTGEAAVQASFENNETQQEAADDYVPIRDYIRKQYADEQFDDDDKVDRKAYKHIKDLETYRTKNKEANQKITALFRAHPELVGVLQDMDAGADFAEALSLNLDPEARKMMRETYFADDYTPKQETWQQKKAEREAKYKERMQWSESYAKNRKESADNLKAFAQEKGMDQAALQDLAQWADNILQSVYNGKVDKQFLDMVYTAKNAKVEIAKAAQAAEVKGRNAAISEKLSKQEPAGDGLPDLSQGGEAPTKEKVPETVKMLGEMVDGFNKRRSKF